MPLQVNTIGICIKCLARAKRLSEILHDIVGRKVIAF